MMDILNDTEEIPNTKAETHVYRVIQEKAGRGKRPKMGPEIFLGLFGIVLDVQRNEAWLGCVCTLRCAMAFLARLLRL
jgi:hypothetical protein